MRPLYLSSKLLANSSDSARIRSMAGSSGELKSSPRSQRTSSAPVFSAVVCAIAG
jgi:hypothetical protein